eukprot:331909_1
MKKKKKHQKIVSVNKNKNNIQHKNNVHSINKNNINSVNKNNINDIEADNKSVDEIETDNEIRETANTTHMVTNIQTGETKFEENILLPETIVHKPETQNFTKGSNKKTFKDYDNITNKKK